MRTLPIMLLATAICAAPAQAREKDVLSWGKAGVSFDTYRADAVTCGRQGYYLDISNTEQATTFKAASSQLDANEASLQTIATMGDLSRMMNIAASSAHIVEATRPHQRIEQLRKIMQDKVTGCLSQLGYKQFRLTPEQKGRLKHLKQGSPERHAYLYGLGSDQKILMDQAV